MTARRGVARHTTYSKRLVVVGDQRAHDGLAGVVVLPDGCSQAEDALQDTGEYGGRGVPAGAFQVTLLLNASLTDARADSNSCPCQFLSATMTSPLVVPGLAL
jgi:hypothetical protein